MPTSQSALVGKPTPDSAVPTRCRDVEALRGCGVLLVDDDPAVRRLVARLFARAGANIYEAGAADAAFEALQRIQPQLLISDIDMPIENGRTLMRRIRALDQQRGGAIAAIALTGDGDPMSRREAMLAGFNEYMAKPFSPAALVDISVALLARVSLFTPLENGRVVSR